MKYIDNEELQAVASLSEIMRTELIDANRYYVVERAQINKAISEQKLQKSGPIDLNRMKISTPWSLSRLAYP